MSSAWLTDVVDFHYDSLNVLSDSTNDHGHVHPRRCLVHGRSLSAQSDNSNRERPPRTQAVLVFWGKFTIRRDP
jgi:hypothetical protein